MTGHPACNPVGERSSVNSIDEALLGRLLDEHAAALELYAAQWCDRLQAQDIVQDALLELVRQHPVPERIVPWLYRVVRNRAVSHFRSEQRRRQRERASAAKTPWFVPDEESSIDADAATRALEELPFEEREIVVARLWGGLTFAEIATLVDKPISTIHRRYNAALETLRKRLGVRCPSTNTS